MTVVSHYSFNPSLRRNGINFTCTYEPNCIWVHRYMDSELFCVLQSSVCLTKASQKKAAAVKPAKHANTAQFLGISEQLLENHASLRMNTGKALKIVQVREKCNLD